LKRKKIIISYYKIIISLGEFAHGNSIVEKYLKKKYNILLQENFNIKSECRQKITSDQTIKSEKKQIIIIW
jgi:hypothetical protein